ncbi:hypothetical protein [Embleya sp. NPDC059259]|uniref:hypothetical protein n=1 Tax=unclassified Embleya TaxID=2699296 RepID=UPI0036B85AD6
MSRQGTGAGRATPAGRLTRPRAPCPHPIRQLVWSHPTIKHSYFKNADGEVYTAGPWRLVDYWNWTKGPDLDDYLVD